MAVRELGIAATGAGWRQKAADAVAPRVARSPLPAREEHVRVALGLLFVALSVKYLVGTVRRAAA